MHLCLEGHFSALIVHCKIYYPRIELKTRPMMLAGDKFICPVPHCSFTRSSKHLVTAHFYQTHFKRFKCKKCGVKASSESRLAEHIENHLGVKGRTKDTIVCEVCSKSMTRTSFTRSGHQLNFSWFFFCKMLLLFLENKSSTT